MMRRLGIRIGLLVIALMALVVADTFRRAPRVAVLEKRNPKVTHWMDVREKQARKAGRKWRVTQSWVALRHVSRPARQAVLAAEDAAFYGHEGFDFHEMKAAIERDWKKRKWARGASTISQQLAKNLWLSPRKTLWRKAEEAILTIRLERSLTKDRILELYLNVAEWGPGVFGIEAASKRYLGKPSSELSAEEGALLAAMLPNPFRLQPGSNPRGVSKRQAMILGRMRRLGYLPAPSPPIEVPPPMLRSGDGERKGHGLMEPSPMEEPVTAEPAATEPVAEEETEVDLEEAEEVPPETLEPAAPNESTEDQASENDETPVPPTPSEPPPPTDDPPPPEP